MKLIKLKCPECGASLEVDVENRDKLFCQYCGTKILLDKEDVNININYVDVAKVKELEYKQAQFDSIFGQSDQSYNEYLEEYMAWSKEKFRPWLIAGLLLIFLPPFFMGMLKNTVSSSAYNEVNSTAGDFIFYIFVFGVFWVIFGGIYIFIKKPKKPKK